MNTTSKGETPSLALRCFSLSISLRIFVPEPDMKPATLMGRPAPLGSKMGTAGIKQHLRREKCREKFLCKTLKPLSF
jgi:hypothetical protein